MLTEVNGTIKIEGNKIKLVIKEDLEKFKKYEHHTNPGKFYADFSLNDEQLWMIGFFTGAEENQKDDTVIMLITSVSKQGNGKACTTAAEIKTLLGLNTKKEVEVQMLQHPRKQVEELKSKVQELQEQLNNQPDAAQLKDKDEKIKTEAKDELKTEELKTEAKNELKADEAIKTEAKNELKTEELKTEAKDELKADEATKTEAKNELKTEELKAEAKDELKTEELKAEAKDELKTEELKAEAKNELKTEELKAEAKNELSNEMQEKVNKLEQIEKEKTDLQTKFDQEKQALEAKSKTIEQPKQSNAARYTAGIGVGLAAGLIAFTALERTVKLEMLVMIGIAVTSALVVGGITYAVLPSTQVDGAKAQGENVKGRGGY